MGGRRRCICCSYPPLLTTMTGEESIQVKPHREDGRLIINAVKAPSKRHPFHMERSNGRLRLYLLMRDDSSSYLSSNSNSLQFNEEAEEDCGEEENLRGNGEAEEEDKKGLNEISKEVWCQSGITKFKRPCRCKEGECDTTENRGILNLEKFWVAT